MKRLTIVLSLIMTAFMTETRAQSGQSPVLQQSTSTVVTPPTSRPKPKFKKTNRRDQMKMEQGLDTTLPKNRRQQRLRPDSLRRGGATRVDTVR